MNDSAAGYSRFREQQSVVLAALDASFPAFQSLDMSAAVDTTSRLARRVRREAFKVLVIGEFKRGKSTFINALLGDEVLPAFATPCTAVINEIKWGAEKRAVLHFRDTPPDALPLGLPDFIRTHLEKNQARPAPPLDVPVEQIEDFVVIPDPAKDQAASIAESPYRLVEIFWPIELCRNGVVLIDSPGLNEHHTRTSITTDYLHEADAVVFVLSCHALGGESEMRVMDNDVRGNGHEQIFVVCNRFDEIRDGERHRIVDYAHSRLAPRTSFGKEGVYFVSARDGLDGRLNGNHGLFDTSGMGQLESDLSRFLVEERGKVKILQPVRELLVHLNRAVTDSIPTQSRLLEQSLERLEEKYREIQPQLHEAEERRRRIMERMTTMRSRIRDDMRRELRGRIRELCTFIPGWLAEYEPKTQIQFVSLESAKAQASSVIREATEYISRKIEDEQTHWRTDYFQPMLRERLQELGEDIQAPLEELLSGLDGLRAHLGDSDKQSLAGREEVHPMERILAAAGGLIVGGAGSALVGGVLGYKEMLKSLIPSFGVAIALAVVGVTNPFLLIGALLGAGTVQGLLSTKAATKKLLQATGDELVLRLREAADNTADSIAAGIHEKTEEIADMVDAGMEREIQFIRDQVESVLREKRQGEAAVAARKNSLLSTSRALGEIQGELNDLVFSLT